MEQDYVAVERVGRSYQGKRVLHRLDLRIRRGELISLLGPSGCGKTTLLRLIAGLDHLEEGRIFLAGRRLDAVPTHKRKVGVVFQSYALFPHLSVADNVAFGLKLKGEHDAATLVQQMLRLVHLSEFGDRPISALSGGQQQRVAVARALATKPDLLLLDEPFSALDKKLREAMQIELRRILQEVGMTAIFVTHDQDEALAMSDRVAVMNEGKVEQFAAPDEVYTAPATTFVLDFVGMASRWQGKVTASRQTHSTVLTSAGPVTVPLELSVGETVTVAVRPEQMRLQGERAEGSNALTLRLRELVYQGLKTEYHFESAPGDRAVVVASNASPTAVAASQELSVSWAIDSTLVYRGNQLVNHECVVEAEAA